MHKLTLSNGLKVIFQAKKGNSAVVEIMINVGSNHEAKDEKGISHFIEHMLFEGTSNRPTNRDISNEIEKVGGDFNAYTTNERTCFHIKVLKKHFPIALEIIGDILQNSLFKESDLNKEKNVVIKEIDMVHDEPRFYQWDLFQKNLFLKHPAKYPIYGDKEIVRKLNRAKVLAYFNKYYVPKNMTLALVGDIKGWKKILEEKLRPKKGSLRRGKVESEPIANRNRLIKEKRNVTSTYGVLGFNTVSRTHPDSYVLEVINGILGRGQSGRMFTEIRAKKGLAYDVGTQYVPEVSYGYFAIYVSVDKNNLNLARDLILKELEKLEDVSEKDIREAKTYIEGEYLLDLEDPQKVADQLLFWEQNKDAKLMKEYISRIKKVTVNDVKRVAKKYFKHYTFAVVEGK